MLMTNFCHGLEIVLFGFYFIPTVSLLRGEMTCLRVKHSINDLAGRLSTPRFFAQMLMDEACSASPLTLGKKSRCA